jgi:DNA recombination protein RmuC
MNAHLITLGGVPVTLAQAAIGFAAVMMLIGLAIMLSLRRAGQARAIEAAMAAERARELDDKVAQLNQLQAEVTGRLATMADVLGSRQAELARAVSERLDQVGHRVGQGLEQQTLKTHESLARLGERLAVIDRAQANLSDLTNEVLILKDILANKQTRGAFGQGRMEAIIRDALPASAYTFQAVLSGNRRPDCLIHLPGGNLPLAIDAKFPLEGFQAIETAQSDEARAQAERQVRTDLGKHIGDIAQRYLVPGETQDIALLFIPSESLYATIAERFEDLIQKAHRARVIIVSPSLLMMAVQVIQALVRDQRMREQAGVIQKEVGLLLDDVRRLQDRSSKLETHFRQAQEDVTGIATSADKITRRGTRIEALEFSEDRKAQTDTPVLRAAE